ncbi:hypothetical protein hairong_080 [Pseudomonas phage hairong]|nr:hypothetical protein hairong_080 [Pseudomonas phage hairong]
MSTKKLLKPDQLSEAGHYWWLPEYLADAPENPDNWQMIFWERNTGGPRDRKGYFQGPMLPPITAKVPTK